MINYDTIISAYKDRPTLMQWLKKVEKALNDVSATSFSVVKKGDATISFKIDFADGSSLESGEIILQQGESVTGASIVNGHLILTLSNGDNLDAGNLGAVSSFSIDGSQHLIVNYQDGTTNDLGAIFNGNVNISGVLTASSVSTPLVTSAGASVEFAKPIDVDVLTSSESSIVAQKPVIEDMTGYGFAKQTPTKGTINYIYAGIVKNGNKLTIVCAYEFTKNEGATGTLVAGRFTMPASVAALIYPSIGTATVDVKRVSALPNTYSDVLLLGSITKYDVLSVYCNLQDITNLVAGTTYYIRQEATFLLSENLAA